MRRETAILRKCIILPITLLAIFCANNSLYAGPKIRELNDSSVSIQNALTTKTDRGSNKDRSGKPALKGGISQLYSIVGKSQIIRFDEPVKRISVADPALADMILISRQEMLLNGKASGTTSLIIWGETGDPVFFDLVVKNDTRGFLEALKSYAPDEKGLDITFSDVTSASSSSADSSGGSSSTAETSKSVIYSGQFSSTLARDKIKEFTAAYGYKIVDLTESSTPQVMIEVKVVEASRALTKSLRGETTGKGSVVPSKIRFFNPFKDATIGTNGSTNEFIFSKIKIPILNATSELRVAENTGISKILAEPKLVVINGKTAEFHAGTQVPIPTGIDPTTRLISFEYKDVGVNLKIKPTILEESGKVLLEMEPEVSELDDTITGSMGNGFIVYGIKTRKTNTTVELNDGETLIIAGLLQRTDGTAIDKIPFLGDIPVLGSLFSSKDFRKGDTELVIFVTPKIFKSGNLVNGV